MKKTQYELSVAMADDRTSRKEVVCTPDELEGHREEFAEHHGVAVKDVRVKEKL